MSASASPSRAAEPPASPARPGRRRVRALLRLAAVALVFAAVIGVLRWLGFAQLLTVDGMRAMVDSWGALGPAVFVAIFVAGFFLPGPELLMAALGGVLFGRVAGFCYAMIAATIGTTATFLLVRYAAQRWVQEALHARFPQLGALDARLARHGILTVLGLRLVLFLSPPLNWALATTRVSVRDYCVGTVLGIAPGLAIAVTLGDAVGHAGSLADLWRVEVVLPTALVLGFLVVAVIAGRRFLARADAVPREREQGAGEG